MDRTHTVCNNRSGSNRYSIEHNFFDNVFDLEKTKKFKTLDRPSTQSNETNQNDQTIGENSHNSSHINGQNDHNNDQNDNESDQHSGGERDPLLGKS